MLNKSSSGSIDPAVQQQVNARFSGGQLEGNVYHLSAMQSVPGGFGMVGPLSGASRPGSLPGVPVAHSNPMQQVLQQQSRFGGVPPFNQGMGSAAGSMNGRAPSGGMGAVLARGAATSGGAGGVIGGPNPSAVGNGAASSVGANGSLMRGLGVPGMGAMMNGRAAGTLGMVQPGTTGSLGFDAGLGAQADMLAVMGKQGVSMMAAVGGGMGKSGSIGKDMGRPAFDASDFPSLGSYAAEGQARGGGGHSGHGSTGSSPADPYGLQFEMLRNKHSSQNGEFSIQNEEFPALGGSSAPTGRSGKQESAGGGGGEGSKVEGRGEAGSQAQAFAQRYGHVPAQSLQTMGAMRGMPPPPPPKGAEARSPPQHQHHGLGRSFGNGIADANVAGVGGKDQPPPPPPPLSGKVGAEERFGLLGLLGVIRMTDPDLTTLALGTDLTTLGLNLNSPDSLYKTFVSPWSDTQVMPEPDFKVPPCYVQHTPPSLQPGYFVNFPLETLFYVFHSMPGEEAQLLSADELTCRGWCYHRELKFWLARVPNTEPLVKTDRYERGSFLVFDSMAWDIVRKDNFVLQYHAIEQAPVGLVRVQFKA